jgi:hypothetical protein
MSPKDVVENLDKHLFDYERHEVLSYEPVKD